MASIPPPIPTQRVPSSESPSPLKHPGPAPSSVPSSPTKPPGSTPHTLREGTGSSLGKRPSTEDEGSEKAQTSRAGKRARPPSKTKVRPLSRYPHSPPSSDNVAVTLVHEPWQRQCGHRDRRVRPGRPRRIERVQCRGGGGGGPELAHRLRRPGAACREEEIAETAHDPQEGSMGA